LMEQFHPASPLEVKKFCSVSATMRLPSLFQ
jgi:hypothetical protein